jgi:hypothetical protein
VDGADDACTLGSELLGIYVGDKDGLDAIVGAALGAVDGA